MRRLEGKVALISGTARGQGRAAALRFAAIGASRRIDVLYAKAVAVRCGAVHEPRKGRGELRDQPPPARSSSRLSQRSASRAELDSVWLAASLTWPHLAASRGCILTVGSTAGLTGSLTNARTAHSASKGAVIALTRQLAAEGAPYGIRANCISPGMIDTEGTRGNLLADDRPMRTIARHIPLARVGVPDEVVNAAVFLASDEASYITGANLVVDGGWSSVLPG